MNGLKIHSVSQLRTEALHTHHSRRQYEDNNIPNDYVTFQFSWICQEVEVIGNPRVALLGIIQHNYICNVNYETRLHT